jgi:hypothetical protein
MAIIDAEEGAAPRGGAGEIRVLTCVADVPAPLLPPAPLTSTEAIAPPRLRANVRGECHARIVDGPRWLAAWKTHGMALTDLLAASQMSRTSSNQKHDPLPVHTGAHHTDQAAVQLDKRFGDDEAETYRLIVIGTCTLTRSSSCALGTLTDMLEGRVGLEQIRLLFE